MLMKINNPLITLLAGYFQEFGKTCNKSSSSSSSNLMVIGLQISLVQTSSEEQSNIILKSTMKKTFQLSLPAMESCFLKSCFLCNKNLSKEKDIYMYRGDQGYCSVECRDRQIYLDEMKELEASTNKFRGTNYRYCSSSGRHETRVLREELRRRNSPVHTVTDHQNHWAIVSFS